MQTVLRVLSDTEIEKLHHESLRVLEQVGFKLTHPEALAKLAQAGARVNHATGLVRLPPELVAELLALAPPQSRHAGLVGQTITVGGQRRAYLSLILDPWICDYRQGRRRPCLADVRRHTIIGQSLARVDMMMRMQFPVSDVPAPDCYLKTMEVFLCHHAKHVSCYPVSVENCREWIDAAAVICDAAGLDAVSTPLLTLATAVTSPLQMHGPNVEIIKQAAAHGYAVVPTVCPMAGTTAPYSLAGVTLLANVESLLPVLIAQLYRPGQPVLYAIGPSVTDMRTGHDLYYKAEKALFKAAGVQMGRFYGLPVAGEAGGTLTDRFDPQNGAESMAYLLASHLAGQHLIGGLGSMYNANGMSAEQIILQCGLADMAEYLAAGIDMSDHKLGFEALQRVGPGGSFLDDDLTLELLRSGEFFASEYLDLSGGYEPGAPGAYDKAHEVAERLVADYRPVVPAKVQAAIKEHFRKLYQDPHVADI